MTGNCTLDHLRSRWDRDQQRLCAQLFAPARPRTIVLAMTKRILKKTAANASAPAASKKAKADEVLDVGLASEPGVVELRKALAALETPMMDLRRHVLSIH